ncbi:Trypsin [compost metagenome]
MKSLKSISLVSLVFLAACSQNNKGSQNSKSNLDRSGIIGGTIVESLDEISRSTVGLRMFEQAPGAAPSYQGRCTGSLIRADLILTAAHCMPTVRPGNRGGLMVIFSQNLDAPESIGSAVISYKYLAHELYGSPEQAKKDQEAQMANPNVVINTYDMALVKLSAPAPQGYVPAKVLLNETFLKEESLVTIAGFGLNSDVNKTIDGHLRKAQVSSLGHYGKEFVVDQQNGSGVCSGDSGGPAFIEVEGTQYLWGVASRVIPKDNPEDKTNWAYCSFLAIHSKVSSYFDFIIKTTAELDK